MDLDIKRVLAAKPGAPEDVVLTPLMTPWGETIDPNAVLAEYPRPQFERDSWHNLNGWWDYAIVESSEARERWKDAMPPEEWDGKILVPFSPEARLSGVNRRVLPNQLLWYRRTIELDEVQPDTAYLLHFEAVDYCCTCYVNGERVGTHRGGYLAFDLNITRALHAGENILELCVWDPSEDGTQLRGKQRLKRGNMWYTAQSGIWQTVWMEEVPSAHVTALELRADADAESLKVVLDVSKPGLVATITVLDVAGEEVAAVETPAGDTRCDMALAVPSPHLWEPNDPYLYDVRVSYGEDRVKSYCAFRTVTVEADDEGVKRFFLNHKPFFLRGLLDQGYWPESLMTAPADEALVHDITVAREAGFNMLRKHIKRESDRWYWHCDRMGMLVWQDMISGGDLPGEWPSVNIPTLFRRSWSSGRDTRPRNWQRFGAGDKDYRTEWLQTARDLVQHLRQHPCIVTWIAFNESWGQFDSTQATAMLKNEDPTRPVVATSGWYDQGAGDYYAVHNYFRSMRVYRDPHAGFLRRRGRDGSRAFVIDEFGGLTCPVEGHTSVPTVYGYDAYEDLGAWKTGLEELLAEVDALEEEGLCGFTYTQISDVEEETNGLMTYDRRINKLD